MLVAIFIAWLLTAQHSTSNCSVRLRRNRYPASSIEIFATGRGWTLIILGHAIGFVFAVVVLCTTVVAFPLLLDRDVGAYEAIHTSVRVVLANPIAMAVWGLIVAVALIIGSLPVFAGLAVVLPILGHATWHVYRKVVEPLPCQTGRKETVCPTGEKRRSGSMAKCQEAGWLKRA